jgi:hypothetical protein
MLSEMCFRDEHKRTESAAKPANRNSPGRNSGSFGQRHWSVPGLGSGKGAEAFGGPSADLLWANGRGFVWGLGLGRVCKAIARCRSRIAKDLLKNQTQKPASSLWMSRIRDGEGMCVNIYSI